MTQLRLVRLHLRHFKGVAHLDVEAAGNDLSVYGDNATGKTTIADALAWVLFGRDSQNRADFEIKTLDAAGQASSGLEHSVEAILDIGAGELLSLRKAYHEVWTKKRGSAQSELTGNTTDHFVDGVPVQKKEFDERVCAIAPEAVFRLLTDPRHFNENLHWQDRRCILLDVCGDVTDAEVIASDPALADLPGILGKRSMEDHKKVIAARRAEINAELKVLPARVDEVTRALEALPSTTVSPDEVEEAQRAVAVLQAERAQIQAGGGAGGEERKVIREVEEAMYRLERDAARSAEEVAAAVGAEHRKASRLVEEAQTAFSAAMAAEKAAAAAVESLSRRVEMKRAEWQEVNAREIQPHTADTCSACQQKLPADQVEAAHKRAVEQLNAKKARELEAISSDGKALRAQHDTATSTYRQRQQDTVTARDRLEAAKAALAATPEPTILPEPQDVKGTAAYQALVLERNAAEARLADAQQGTATAVEAINTRIQAATETLTKLQALQAQAAQRTSLNGRLSDLTSSEELLAEEFERLERELFLIEAFIRAKVSLLTDRINGRFRIARFKLFDTQVNGGLTETCETTVDGVPYASLNNGMRLAVGLDIIRTLSEHHALWPFVVVDNAESVTHLPTIDAQLIRLVVSEADKALRIEPARMEVAA